MVQICGVTELFWLQGSRRRQVEQFAPGEKGPGQEWKEEENRQMFQLETYPFNSAREPSQVFLSLEGVRHWRDAGNPALIPSPAVDRTPLHLREKTWRIKSNFDSQSSTI